MLPEAEEKEEKGGNLAIRMPVSYHNSSEPPVTACKVIEFAAKEGRWSCGFMDVDVAGASKKHWPFKRIIKFAIKPRECQAAPMNERRKCGKWIYIAINKEYQFEQRKKLTEEDKKSTKNRRKVSFAATFLFLLPLQTVYVLLIPYFPFFRPSTSTHAAQALKCFADIEKLLLHRASARCKVTVTREIFGTDAQEK